MSTKMNPTIRDVALEAAVSPMTASRVLSGQAKVSESKRQAVLAAAGKLGYQVNPIVRSVMSEMRRRKANQFAGTIAFLNTSNQESAWREHEYNRAYLEGARERADQSGFALDEIWIGQSDWPPLRTLKVLQTRRIRGFLIPPGGTEAQMEFSFAEFAVAAFGSLPFKLLVNQVMPDYFYNSATCYEHLWASGYRRIGLFSPDYDMSACEYQNVGGFLSAQWKRPRKWHVPVGSGAVNWQAAEGAFLKWFQQHRPDAIIVSYDQVPRWLEKIEVSIPRDIGLAHPLLSHNTAGWSGVDLRSRLQGEQAIDLLTAQILRNETGLPREPKRLVIPGVWVEGNTTQLVQA